MKKKIIILVMTASLMVAGVVSAASVWGSYKGNDIIRITSNGSPLKTSDVPAISYNGRTMIPISMLSQIGLGYTWDQNNKTVDVDINSSVSTTNKSSNDQILSLVKLADYYVGLDKVGEALKATTTSYEVIYNHYRIGTDPGVTLKDANDSLNYSINIYNLYQKDADDMIKLSSNNNGSPNINEILNSYNDAIDHLKSGYEYLEKLTTTYNQQNYNLYFNNTSAAISLAYDGANKSTTSYKYLIERILK